MLGADRYGSWPSEMRGVPSLAHIPGAHLSDSCHPHPGQLDPTQEFLYNASLSQRPAQEGQCPPSAPAPGPFLFTLFSFYLFWLHWVLAAACGMRNLVPRSGNEAGPLHWEQRLSPWTTRAGRPCPDLIKGPQRSLAVGLGHLPSLIRWSHRTSFLVKPLATLGSQLSGPSAVPASLCFLWHQSKYRAGLVAVVDLSPPICPLGDHGGGS